MKLTGGFY